MPFPVSPNPGDSYTDAYGTVWIYAGSVNGWYRQEVVPGNETTYTGGGSGSATATGAAGEIQFTDGTNLDASPNLVWDDANDELEVTGDLKLLDGGSWTTTLQTITPTQNNTISLPNATGTVALVAGSSGQLVYNNAGVYAGIPGSTVGASGNVTLNAASGFTGNLLDLQVGGTSAFRFTGTSINGPAVFGFNTTGSFRFDSSGAAGPFFIQSNQVRVANFGITFCTGTNYNTPEFSLLRDAANTLAQRNDTNAQTFRVYNTYTSSTNYELGKLEWSSNVFRIGTEKGSGGGTARALEFQTDGTTRATIAANGQTTFSGGVRLDSYLDFSTLGTIKYTANSVLKISNTAETDFNRLQFGGTTSSFPALKRNSAVLETKLADDSAYAQHAASVFQAATAHTFNTLPATPTVGMIARVTDANAPAVGVNVAGGGSAAALVWYNGTNWTVIGV